MSAIGTVGEVAGLLLSGLLLVGIVVVLLDLIGVWDRLIGSPGEDGGGERQELAVVVELYPSSGREVQAVPVREPQR